MFLYESVKKSQKPKQTFDEITTFASRKNRYLLRVLLELSPICNFTCPFCYVRKTPQEMLEEGKKVLRFSYWKDILDQLFEMGVLYIGFTGGECMLHPDFVEIYEYAAYKGFFIYLISNCSCLSDHILDTFKKFPPKTINITVYGSSEKTYQKICGNGEYYNKVRTNLKRLSEENIPFAIQMTVSRDNVSDIPEIYELSKKLNVKFYCGNTLTASGRCTEEIQDANSVSDDHFRDMMRIIRRMNKKEEANAPKPIPPKTNIKGIACSAGRCSAFINHQGLMHICVGFQEIGVSTFEHSLNECWREIVQAADQIPNIEECNGCIHASRCIHCFGAHYYDTGNFTTPSPKLCFKALHPDEAARLEAYYAEYGVLPPEEY